MNKPLLPKIIVMKSCNGGTMVFDPSIQVEDSSFVYLYNATTEQMHIVEKNIRNNLKVVSDSIAIISYNKWLENKGVDYFKFEHRKREEIKKQIKINHTSFLHNLNIYNGGEQKPSPLKKRHRTPCCYRCQAPLDNHIQLECTKCGWIICECGACGCGYYVIDN